MRVNTLSLIALATLLTATLVAGMAFTAGAASKSNGGKNMAHGHMGHVTQGWKDTPGGKGLLPTALDEAKVAAQHAGFAAGKPDDLGWMKTHTRHVLNAIDPSIEAKGPGMGYGVTKATAGVAAHIGFAADSPAASGNVKAHATHVGTAAFNVSGWSAEIVKLGKQVLASDSASQAAPLVRKIATLTRQLSEGVDANGDGKITWQQGEGGLNEAAKHMGLMAKGEGM